MLSALVGTHLGPGAAPGCGRRCRRWSRCGTGGRRFARDRNAPEGPAKGRHRTRSTGSRRASASGRAACVRRPSGEGKDPELVAIATRGARIVLPKGQHSGRTTTSRSQMERIELRAHLPARVPGLHPVPCKLSRQSLHIKLLRRAMADKYHRPLLRDCLKSPDERQTEATRTDIDGVTRSYFRRCRLATQRRLAWFAVR